MSRTGDTGGTRGNDRTSATSATSERDDERALCAEVLRACTQDRARYVFDHPHLATLALQLELTPVIDERCPTAATDGRRVFFNPYWMRRRSSDARAFVLAHEVWHNALLHFARRGDRAHGGWALAIDHEVNALLRRDGLPMPADAVYFPRWDGLSAEQVYARLRSHEGRGPDADVHLDDPRRRAATDDPQRRASLDDDAFGPIVGRRDPSFGGRPDDEATRRWRDLLVVHGGRLRGVLPAELSATIDAIARPSIPWQAVLRDFVAQSSGGSFRWAPPARRHAHRGLFLPSRRADVLSLAVALDTSGSTTELWPRLAGELTRLLRAFGRYEVRVLQCDAKVQRDERYDEASPLPERLTFIGGGGTHFGPVFRALADDPPNALVFLTDGFGDAPSEAPPYPVLWTLTPDGRRPCSWGTTLRLAPA